MTVETGSSVDISQVETPLTEQDYDENGLRETDFGVEVMYTTVEKGHMCVIGIVFKCMGCRIFCAASGEDSGQCHPVEKDYLTASTITGMWDTCPEAFISNSRVTQPLYEAEGYSDVYVAFIDYGALNNTEGEIISADFSRNSIYKPVDMKDNVVFDKETGVVVTLKMGRMPSVNAWLLSGVNADALPTEKNEAMRLAEYPAITEIRRYCVYGQCSHTVGDAYLAPGFESSGDIVKPPKIHCTRPTGKTQDQINNLSISYHTPADIPYGLYPDPQFAL